MLTPKGKKVYYLLMTAAWVYFAVQAFRGEHFPGWFVGLAFIFVALDDLYEAVKPPKVKQPTREQIEYIRQHFRQR